MQLYLSQLIPLSDVDSRSKYAAHNLHFDTYKFHPYVLVKPTTHVEQSHYLTIELSLTLLSLKLCTLTTRKNAMTTGMDRIAPVLVKIESLLTRTEQTKERLKVPIHRVELW